MKEEDRKELLILEMTVRKVEIVKKTGNLKEGPGLEKPANLKTFTQLKIQEVLTKKSSWSPGKCGGQETGK